MKFDINITIKHKLLVIDKVKKISERDELKKEMCEVCGKEFGNLQYMYNHVRNKKDEEHKKYYKKLMASK